MTSRRSCALMSSQSCKGRPGGREMLSPGAHPNPSQSGRTTFAAHPALTSTPRLLLTPPPPTPPPHPARAPSAYHASPLNQAVHVLRLSGGQEGQVQVQAGGVAGAAEQHLHDVELHQGGGARGQGRAGGKVMRRGGRGVVTVIALLSMPRIWSGKHGMVRRIQGDWLAGGRPTGV